MLIFVRSFPIIFKEETFHRITRRSEMDSKNGSDYAQNYDIIVKWLAGALRGQTLDAIGVKTGRIEEVFGFEPSDISVRMRK
jgi:hypothetical protein